MNLVLQIVHALTKQVRFSHNYMYTHLSRVQILWFLFLFFIKCKLTNLVIFRVLSIITVRQTYLEKLSSI